MAEVSSTATTGSSIANTVLTTLDVGSGLDIGKLAQDLTDAEKLPKQNSINSDIADSEASITGYAEVSFQVNLLKTAFEAINDADELATSNGTSSDSTKVSFSSVAGNAAAGAYDISVSQLAESQRTVSDQFASTTTSLNSGTAFDLSLAVGATQKGTYDQIISQATLRTALSGGSISLSDGTNSFTISQSQVNTAGGTSSGGETLAGYVAAIESNKPADFQFDFAVNGTSGVTFTQKTAGTGVLTSGAGEVNSGIVAATPVTGVAAIYRSALTASVTGTLSASDGTNSVSVASATYANVADQVAAIQAAAGYEDLLFTVAANGNNIDLTYKTTGAISTAPTVSVGGTSQTVTNPTSGVTAVNSPVVTKIPVTTTTPAGVVEAINAANKGVSASLVDTGTGGNNFRIVLSGDTGIAGTFAVTSSISDDLGFGDADKTLQTAQDAVINFEGLTINRGSNSVNDVISGTTIDLNGVTSSAVRLNVTSDTSTLKTSLQDVVTVYNSVNSSLDNMGSVKDGSTDTLNGALAGDGSLISYIKNNIRTAVFNESSTKSGNVNALRDLGISIDRSGKMTFDETTYNSMVLNNFDDISKMLTAGTSNQSAYDTAAQGLSQDIATTLEGLTDKDGIVTTRSTNASSVLADHKEELTKLETRMTAVYQRYLSQFTAMESMMASLDATKDYLTGQLESLSKAYDS
ncbi:flagellar filament capping protein FliD [Porticoccaceae bacterium]|nr:flagellar filament capping protein FliD [Porticoccaceae bacterium]MDB2319709.1 flagellar filament capping protein FliD [Porticoccaceae bacterium]